MDYPALRFQFVLGAGVGSRLIAWWGNGYGGFSHVDALLSDSTCLGARSDTAGGQPPGVRIRPAGYEKWKKRYTATLAVKLTEYAAWEVYLRAQVGLPYDHADILGLITGRELAQTGHWICSALQTAGLQAIHRLPALPVTPSQVTPNSFLLVLAALGFAVTEA